MLPVKHVMPLVSSGVGFKSQGDRKTPELVFAFVEPIGGGATQAVQVLREILESQTYKYEVDIIPVSKIIEEEAIKEKFSDPTVHEKLASLGHDISKEAKRINRLQQFGNMLREKHSPEYLAKKIIQKIFEYRKEHKGFTYPDEKTFVPQPIRVAHIIKSIKNKAEYALLRSVYGPMLLLVAVSGDYEQQVKNFHQLQDAEEANLKIYSEYDVLAGIDQKEKLKTGQQVRDVFYKANLFVNSNTETIKDDITRFLDLLFSRRIISPSTDERMMFEAFSASVRSTCLSRQVGAAIADEYNDLVSVGWNDVPAFKGGLSSDYNFPKALCKSLNQCRSDKEKYLLINSAFEALKSGGLLKAKASLEDFKQLISTSVTNNLIEFSRAIHAEMEAILSAARNARLGLRDGTLYVTTYPCDNCVKHILAAGLRRVVYIEPYPKSRARAFFSDFLGEVTRATSSPKWLQLDQFVGIAPESYVSLFRQCADRKNQSGLLLHTDEFPMPKIAAFLDGYTHYEGLIAMEATDEEPK